jgi:hypothetical protein
MKKETILKSIIRYFINKLIIHECPKQGCCQKCRYVDNDGLCLLCRVVKRLEQ